MNEPSANQKGRVRILLLEANRADAALCIHKLTSAGLATEVDVVNSSEQFIEKALANPYDIVLSDYRLPSWSGMEALRWLRSSGRDIPLVLVSGTLGDELAVECIKEGANDYVLKDSLDRLPVAVRRALEEGRLRQERDRAEQELRKSEEQYRLLFYSNPHPMWVFDSETLRFLAVNHAAIRHYGYSLREFLSMTVKDIRPAEELERFVKSVDRRVDPGETP